MEDTSRRGPQELRHGSDDPPETAARNRSILPLVHRPIWSAVAKGVFDRRHRLLRGSATALQIHSPQSPLALVSQLAGRTRLYTWNPKSPLS